MKTKTILSNNILFHHLDYKSHHALFVAVFLRHNLCDPTHLVALCHKSLVIVVNGQITDVVARHTILVQSAQYGQVVTY